MKIRLIIVAVLAAAWIAAALLLTQFGPQREAGEIAAALRTPKPTFTATAMPTCTLPPSPTPTSTSTPTLTPTATPTPLPTDTPLPTPTPTDTATLPPTSTPTAAPTSTPKPTGLPTKQPPPAPTSTPALPFTGTVAGASPNCGTMGVWGYAWTASGAPQPGVRVGVWSDAWVGRLSAPTDVEGKYTVLLSDLPPGEFLVAVVDPASCETHVGALTAHRCTYLSAPIRVTLYPIEECANEGTIQWSEVHFRAR